MKQALNVVKLYEQILNKDRIQETIVNFGMLWVDNNAFERKKHKKTCEFRNDFVGTQIYLSSNWLGATATKVAKFYESTVKRSQII